MLRSKFELHKFILFMLASEWFGGLFFRLSVCGEVHSRIAINIDDVNNVLGKDNWRDKGRKNCCCCP